MHCCTVSERPAAVPAVLLDRVTMRRGGKMVLDNVCALVEVGDFVGVVGPNGGGKTTLLQVILGVLPPDSGRVQVLGMNPRADPAVRRSIGHLAQLPRHDLLFPVSALDVVCMGALARLGDHGRSAGTMHTGSQVVRELSLQALEHVGLRDLADRHFGGLSGGQRQLVLLARAIAGRPQLLLLDEPLTGLDQQRRSTFYPLVNRIRQTTGATVVAICHDFRNLVAHVDRLLCLDRGLHEHPGQKTGSDGPQDGYLAERCLYDAVFAGSRQNGPPGPPRG